MVTLKSLDQIESVLRGVLPVDLKDEVKAQLRHRNGVETPSRKNAVCDCNSDERVAGDCADARRPAFGTVLPFAESINRNAEQN